MSSLGQAARDRALLAAFALQRRDNHSHARKDSIVLVGLPSPSVAARAHIPTPPTSPPTKNASLVLSALPARRARLYLKLALLDDLAPRWAKRAANAQGRACKAIFARRAALSILPAAAVWEGSTRTLEGRAWPRVNQAQGARSYTSSVLANPPDAIPVTISRSTARASAFVAALAHTNRLQEQVIALRAQWGGIPNTKGGQHLSIVHQVLISRQRAKANACRVRSASINQICERSSASLAPEEGLLSSQGPQWLRCVRQATTSPPRDSPIASHVPRALISQSTARRRASRAKLARIQRWLRHIARCALLASTALPPTRPQTSARRAASSREPLAIRMRRQRSSTSNSATGVTPRQHFRYGRASPVGTGLPATADSTPATRATDTA
mmetsp:Transcript_50427/g.133256  ORF Transcript_50427/g.133256 Transcript_50427/m.133256 type:complete len:386 (+) Transcript_50427:25-1182(+)